MYDVNIRTVAKGDTYHGRGLERWNFRLRNRFLIGALLLHQLDLFVRFDLAYKRNDCLPNIDRGAC